MLSIIMKMNSPSRVVYCADFKNTGFLLPDHAALEITAHGSLGRKGRKKKRIGGREWSFAK